MIVVLSATATILAVSAALMHFVLQMDSEVRQRTHAVATIGRLAEQFRRDVHQARGEPVIATDRRTAELHFPGGTIIKWWIDEYREVIRTKQAHGVADREDTFTLPKGTMATLELQSQGVRRIVTIRIESPGSGGPSLAIEALVSRDERLAVEEEKP